MNLTTLLVKGKVPHLAGKRIRTQEDLSETVVRRVVADRSTTAGEELHKEYEKKFAELPQNMEHT